jgi:phage baseplate assembly protein W
MAIGYSVKLPLKYSQQDGPYSLNKALNDTIRQNLKHLLLTNPGERIMDLSFGVGLRNYIHEPLTPITKDRIKNKINEQVKRYMPFITITKLDVISREAEDGKHNDYLNDESLLITINYTFAGSPSKQILSLPIK